MTKRAIVIGGTNGLGLSISKNLIKQGYELTVFGRTKPRMEINANFIKCDLLKDNLDIFDDYLECDALIITAGMGRVEFFENLSEAEIIKITELNATITARLIKKFYPLINSNKDFNAVVLSSIAGIINSPLYSVYSASKAYVHKLIEALNSELTYNKINNRILCVSPGSIKGTSFTGEDTNLDELDELSNSIITKMHNKEMLYIPNEEIYNGVINRYYENKEKFGLESIKYKIDGNRLSGKKQVIVGFINGTYDLFHIGHLNIIKKAKEKCDYLVVAVHTDAKHKNKEVAISLDERVEIVKSIKYVDKVITGTTTEIKVYEEVIKYDRLFVGSDYKGTDKFNEYEEYFKPKNVEIIYFPYTPTTSSSKLRGFLDKK